MKRTGLKEGEWSMRGPFFCSSVSADGKARSLDRDDYYIEVSQRAGRIYKLVRYRSAKHRIIVSGTYPQLVFRSLKKTANYLAGLKKPLMVCS
jgi:hypothetical protein